MADETPSTARAGILRVWAFVAVLAAAAVPAQAAIGGLASPMPDVRLGWPLLTALFALSEVATVRVHIRRHGYNHTLSEVPLVLGLALASPVVLITARLVGTAAVLLLHMRQRSYKLAFNLVRLWLETALVVLVYRTLLGSAAVTEPQAWLATGAAIAVGTAFAVGSFVVVIGLLEGRLDPASFRWAPVASGAVATANTSIGLLALLTLVHEPAAFGLVAVVALVTFVAYRAYGSWRDRHGSLERLHALTHDADTLPTRLATRRILLQAADLMGAHHAEAVVLDPHDTTAALRAVLHPDGRVVEEHGAAARLMPSAPEPPGGLKGVAAGLWSRLGWGPPVDELTVALRGKAGTIGHVRVAGRHTAEDASGAHDRRLFETFANHASVALENSRLVERLRDEIAVRKHEASHDALTGLPNRTLFHRRVTEAIAHRRSDEWLAVLLVDLDHFKAVNDTLGHHVGDRLLAWLAGTMESTLKASELVARLGGDEFAVLLTDLHGPDDARAAAERLRRTLAQPVVVDDLQFEIAGSVGISVCPDNGTDSSTLLRRADVAMYLAKHQRSGVEFYRPEQDPNTPRRLRLAGSLREAIEGSQLVVHYQPKALLETGAVSGVEALVRWQHPEDGLLGPDEFIPVAEQTGLIRPLTEYVLRSALTDWGQWAQRGHDLEVAVNLSQWSLIDGQLVADLQALLAECGAPARALRLEITESGMMTDPRRTADVLGEAHALGIGVSIDDFGTGYSSLSWLNRLPVDEVKIDRSFVKGIRTDEADLAIVRSTIDLGRSLGLTVVAEGVEDRGTWRRLRGLRCHAAQGYLLSRPMAGDAVLGWLQTYKEGDAPVTQSDTLQVP